MLIELPILWIIILDFIAWFFFHMLISWLCLKIPDHWLHNNQTFFKSRSFERNGDLWQSLFHIKSWKKFLPDASFILKANYDKKELGQTNVENLEKFLIEINRAELTHWLAMLPAFLFFIWNPLWAGFIMIAYAILANLPFILTQRYNRPRLQRLLQLKQQREAGK